jgi:hypothetical protein
MVIVFSALIVILALYIMYTRGNREIEKETLTRDNNKLDTLRRYPKLNENYNSANEIWDLVYIKYLGANLNENHKYLQKTRDEERRIFGQGYISEKKHLQLNIGFTEDKIFYKVEISVNHKKVLFENGEEKNPFTAREIAQRIIKIIEKV